MTSAQLSRVAVGCFIWCLSLVGCAASEPDASASDDPGQLSSMVDHGDDAGVDEFVDKAFVSRVLNLRVHIMRDITFTVRGVNMTNSHISPSVVRDQLHPELNRIWAPAGIVWNLESIIEENVVKPADFVAQKRIVETAARDENGHSDDDRLPPLYNFMDPKYRSTRAQLGRNLFHIYIYPFIGNTSQGNAMRSFGFHSVVGSWSNKHNGGGTPIRRNSTESPNRCVNGSLGRTIAHELGHVLSLQHNQCTNCLMDGCGYSITNNQVTAARAEAKRRIQ